MLQDTVETLKQTYFQGYPESAGCVQGSIDSRNSAIHSAYRISLRPSSLFEPRHPSLKVVMFNVALVQDGSRQAHDKPREPQDRPKTGPREAKTGPRQAKTGQDRPKTHPRQAQDRPRRPKTGPRQAQDRPRQAQDTPKTESRQAQDRP